MDLYVTTTSSSTFQHIGFTAWGSLLYYFGMSYGAYSHSWPISLHKAVAQTSEGGIQLATGGRLLLARKCLWY